MSQCSGVKGSRHSRVPEQKTNDAAKIQTTKKQPNKKKVSKKQVNRIIVADKDESGEWHGSFSMQWVATPDVEYCRGTYSHGKEVGMWTFYAPDGRIWYRRNYDLSDEFITFYRWSTSITFDRTRLNDNQIDEIRRPYLRCDDE